MGLVAAVIGSAVVGAGTSLYGISQQSSANDKATQANIDETSAANQSGWNNYLLSRGESFNGGAPTGTLPSGGTPVNTKLPLWATANFTTGLPKWTKAGAAISPTPQT